MKITGKPEQTGTYTLRFTLSNPVGEDVRTFTLKVDAELPKISPATLKNGTTGKKYSAAVKTKGSKPITLSMSESLPAGLTFNAGTGIIEGTPTEECNNLPITITALNTTKTVTKKLKLTIADSSSTTSSRYANHAEDYVIVYELGTVSVDESGMYDFDVLLSGDVPADSALAWLAESDDPSDDDDIAEFYDSDGEETAHVPDDRIITVSAWLNEGTTYSPAIAIKH